MNTIVTAVEESQITLGMFANKTSHGRFLKAFRMAKKVQEKKDQGFLIFENGKLIYDGENFVVDLHEAGASLGIGTPNGKCGWIGYTYCPKTDKVYVEKEDLYQFESLRYVSPKNIKSFGKVK